MKTDWTSLVSHISKATLATASLKDNCFCKLDHLGLIHITGQDAESFLQGQFTHDVRQVTATHSQLTGYCTPKGRLLACGRLFRDESGDGYYWQLPSERVSSIIKKLQSFVLRARVQLQDVGASLTGFGIAGPNIDEWSHDVLAIGSMQLNEVKNISSVTILRVPGMVPRFELYSTTQPMDKLQEKLARKTFTSVENELWRWLNIQSGLPTIYDTTADMLIPQMVNLDQLDGISFKKGCYTGQEIIARTQHLGVVKRRLYRLHIDIKNKSVIPAVGNTLVTPKTMDNSLGQLIEVCRSPIGGYDALAVIATDIVFEQQVMVLRDIPEASLALWAKT